MSFAVLVREYHYWYVHEDCRFDPQSIATLKGSFVELKLLPQPPDMSKLYTNPFCRARCQFVG